jgi:hypothetical protein
MTKSIIEYLALHGVTPDEFEEVVLGSHVVEKKSFVRTSGRVWANVDRKIPGLRVRIHRFGYGCSGYRV